MVCEISGNIVDSKLIFFNSDECERGDLFPIVPFIIKITKEKMMVSFYEVIDQFVADCSIDAISDIITNNELHKLQYPSADALLKKHHDLVSKLLQGPLKLTLFDWLFSDNREETCFYAVQSMNKVIYLNDTYTVFGNLYQYPTNDNKI